VNWLESILRISNFYRLACGPVATAPSEMLMYLITDVALTLYRRMVQSRAHHSQEACSNDGKGDDGAQ
jgi:hypothetical protein